jgi:thiol-disulfide isomerase/thioredoxin
LTVAGTVSTQQIATLVWDGRRFARRVVVPPMRGHGNAESAGAAETRPFPVENPDVDLEELRARIAAVRSMTVLGRVRMPSLGGATGWLCSEPFGAAELRGHVVIVNFWTFTCINWLRQEPYVRAWSQAYRNDGLVVIGVHTPEFSFEHDIDRVRQATKVRGIDYPVAVDNGYEIWSAFDNQYWPALYFVDAEGIIRDYHFGEGRYEQLERVIQRLLGVERELVSVEGRGVEAEADWDHLRTPETYLGYGREERFASPNGAARREGGAYELPQRLAVNHWGLTGGWTIGPEKVVLDRARGSIAYRFHARDAHLVLSGEAPQPIPFRVLLDGEPPGASHGVDVDEDGNGWLRAGRLYQLVREHDAVRERTLEITFLEPGAEAYVFTFG